MGSDQDPTSTKKTLYHGIFQDLYYEYLVQFPLDPSVANCSPSRFGNRPLELQYIWFVLETGLLEGILL